MVCVAAAVEAGINVGGDVGLALGLPPPHAARSNARVKKRLVLDNLGQHLPAGVGFKAASPVSMI